MNHSQLRRISTLVNPQTKPPQNFAGRLTLSDQERNHNPIPIPHRTIPEPEGQDLDYINIAHSHLVHSDWSNLSKLASTLTPFRAQHILLRTKQDHVLSLQFYNWVPPEATTLQLHSTILHILTKNRKFKSAESIFRKVLASASDPGLESLCFRILDALVYTYRMCESSSRVFDCLFKTFAHLNKFRCATDTFVRMRQHGFVPTVESCNAFMSALNGSGRADIVLGFYKEMGRSRISPNVYTLNMVIGAYCKLGKLEKAVEVFDSMEKKNVSPNVASYNNLIAGYCSKGLLSGGVKLKNLMEKNGLRPSEITYNTLINGFCKEEKLHEANKLFREMKSVELNPTVVTYNTLLNGYSQVGNSEMGGRLFEEMKEKGIKADILTYNALILGLCKEGKTRKAAYMVKELDTEKLVPNASTFAALISGQCLVNNAERAFEIYKSMIRSGCHPNKPTFTMLMSAFVNNDDYDGAVQVLREMLKRLISPDSRILSELCDKLRQCGKKEMVFNLYKEVESRQLLPEGFQRV